MNKSIGWRLACFLVVLCALVRPARAGNYRWSTAGPEPGLVSQVVVNPQNSDRLGAVAGYFGQFVFWSSDRGQTWTQDETLSFAQRLIQDPSNPSVLYVFGAAGSVTGVFKTVDGGLFWAPAGKGLPSGLLSNGLALAPSAPTVLYLVANSAQVYRSDDAGDSWSLAPGSLPPMSFVSDVKVDPSNSAVVYVVGYPGVFKSTDSGASWLPSGSFVDALRLAVDPTDPSTLYIATGDSGVWKSIDGGAHWSPANVGIETANARDLAIDPSNTQRLWIAASAAGALVSEDGAQSWAPVALGPAAPFASAVAVDPRNPLLVYAGAGLSTLRGGLQASADGGVTWASRSLGLSGFLSGGVVGDASAGAIAHCVSDGNFWKSDDAGASWLLKGQASYFLSSLVSDPSASATFYASYGYNGTSGVLKTLDEGATWNPAQSGLVLSNLYKLSISPSAPDRLLAAGFEGLFGTTDGGGIWAPLLAGDMRSGAFDSEDPSILYAGAWLASATGDALLRSSDGGVTWAPPAGLPTSYPHVFDIAVPRADPSHVYATVYASGAGQGVYRSVDRGLSFAPANTGLTPGLFASRLATDPSDSATLYVVGEPSPSAAPEGAFLPSVTAPPLTVFRTRDGAQSWIPVPGSLPAWTLLDLSVSADGRTLYTSTLAGIFTFRRSFDDVPDADLFWGSIDAAAMNGVTAGCGAGRFCPSSSTSRASIAVFLLRGKNGATFTPPPATGSIFGDVAAGSAAADFIEELSNEGITAGCGGGNYCPAAVLTRAEMAVLLLKTEHGADYAPPPATGAVFTDVPADAFAAAWIEQLSAEGISAGCGQGAFCPSAPLSRAQAAALVVRAFGLS